MKQYIVGLIAALAVGYIVTTIPFESPYHFILVFINAEISTISMFAYKERPYSLHKVVNFFILIFFVLANTIQYSHHSITSSVYVFLSVSDYEHFQTIVFLILFSFNLGYPLLRFPLKKRNVPIFLTDSSSKYFIILSIISFLIVIYHWKDNLLALYFRGVTEVLYVPNESDTNVAGGLLFSYIFRSMPFSCFIWAAHYNLPRKTQLLLFLIMLLALFPTGLARNTLAAYYIPVVIMKIRMMRKPNFFVGALLVGFLFVFPLMDSFRYFLGEDYAFEYSLSFLDSMHLDSSHEFMIIMKEHLITYGYQLLGPLLFWIPSSIWKGKPGGSGFLLANKHGEFPNISMPFFGEGYINFGYVGVALFTLFLIYFCARLDSKYWKEYSKGYDSTFEPYYLVLVASMTFILRGDLMSSTAFTVGSLCNLFLTRYLVIKFSKKYKMSTCK